MCFSQAQQVNLPACSPHCPFNAERQAGKLRILTLKWCDPIQNQNQSLQSVRDYSAGPTRC